MRSSIKTHRLSLTRSLLCLFLFATALKVWFGPLQAVPIANAQIPDSGAQRNRLIQEVRSTNQLLTQVLHTLEAGNIKVRIVTADKPPEKAKDRQRR